MHRSDVHVHDHRQPESRDVAAAESDRTDTSDAFVVAPTSLEESQPGVAQDKKDDKDFAAYSPEEKAEYVRNQLRDFAG